MIESLFSMQGKVCLITGGSRGLGAFMAQGFLEAGAERVYITARKAAPCLEAAEATIDTFRKCFVKFVRRILAIGVKYIC